MKIAMILLSTILLSPTAPIICETLSLQAGKGKADLVVSVSHPMTGHIVVKNIGSAPAGPTKLTLDCEKAGVNTRIGGCPPLPPSYASTYFDPAFPLNATVKVPALASGEVFDHTFAFWPELKWTKGKYVFTVRADAANAIDEIDKKNNVTTSTLTVP